MMLSRVRQSLASAALRRNVFGASATRGYLNDLGLDSQSLAVREDEGKSAGAVDFWKAQVDATKNGLVLKENEEIETYVLSIVRDYFRTTKKASVDIDCAFADHGLDSLDVIEFVIRIEDELGYVVDAENLEKFKKPRHFVNFIKHMEAYKEEFNRNAHVDEKASFNMSEAFPGLPKMGH